MSDGSWDVPVEEDTNILFESEATLGDYDVLYQKWTWEGIFAESIVFRGQDVAELSDAEIEAEVRTSPLVRSDSQVTIKRTNGDFAFVNFNFESE